VVLDSFILPAAYSVLALLLTWITNALFVEEGESEAGKWWHFYRDAMIIFVKFLFLTLFFVIAMHRILLAMVVLTILFLLIFSRPNV